MGGSASTRVWPAGLSDGLRNWSGHQTTWPQLLNGPRIPGLAPMLGWANRSPFVGRSASANTLLRELRRTAGPFRLGRPRRHVALPQEKDHFSLSTTGEEVSSKTENIGDARMPCPCSRRLQWSRRHR